jgi:hypothetical protein
MTVVPLRRLLAVLAVTVVGSTLLAGPADAATPPRRPHPHRKPWPVTITVQTVPVLAGVHLSFDGKVITTDAAGRATVTQEHNFGKHTLTLTDTTISGPTRRFRFVRWAGQRDPDQAFKREVTGLPMRNGYTVTAAFAVQYPVKPTFTGAGGRPLDLDRIDEVSVRADTGEIIRLDPAAVTWLGGQAPVYRNSAVTLVPTSYTLQRVIVDGTNVVDVGQQGFRPAQGTPVTFATKFFDLQVKAHDALYKNGTGETATVTYPNGMVRNVSLGPDHTATLTDLPRGVYQVNLEGDGTSLPSQVTLSRNTSTDLVVATRKDLVTLALVGLALAAGLLLLGRGRRRVRSAVVAAAQPIQRSAQQARRGRAGPVTAPAEAPVVDLTPTETDVTV